MKVLQINKYYYPRSGSERYMLTVSSILEKHGHQVIPFAMQHEDTLPTKYIKYFVETIEYEREMRSSIFRKAYLGFKVIYSIEARNKLLQLISAENPQIAHIHKFNNTLTPSILYVLRKKRIPAVQTLHDYRTICPNYNLYDFNKCEICEDCKGHRYFNAVRRKCQKSSYLVGLNIAIESYMCHFLRTYEKAIDLFISPSKFLMEKLVEFGVDGRKIVHLPYPIRYGQYKPRYDGDGYIVYFGRLEKHKGLKTLATAMKDVIGVRLYVIGDGAYRQDVEKYVEHNDIENVEFCGFRTGSELAELVANGLFTVVPSEWYENYPYAVLESFAMGKPVVGAEIGGIPELVQDGVTGLLFQSGNAKDLAEKINCLASDLDSVRSMGRNARKRVEEWNNEDAHYERLLEAYAKVL